MKPVLLDTGVIVALLDRHERYHGRSVRAVEDVNRPLITCEAVIAEACYLLRHMQGASWAVLANVEAGIFQIPFQVSRSAGEVERILRAYADLPADFADACLIRLAEECETDEILTLDHDFELYRWRRNRRFRLLIPL